MFDNATFNGTIQRFGNMHSIAGEYSKDVMLICPCNGPLHIMPIPIVSHQRNRYSVRNNAGIKYLQQHGVLFQWGLIFFFEFILFFFLNFYYIFFQPFAIFLWWPFFSAYVQETSFVTHAKKWSYLSRKPSTFGEGLQRANLYKRKILCIWWKYQCTSCTITQIVKKRGRKCANGNWSLFVCLRETNIKHNSSEILCYSSASCNLCCQPSEYWKGVNQNIFFYEKIFTFFWFFQLIIEVLQPRDFDQGKTLFFCQTIKVSKVMVMHVFCRASCAIFPPMPSLETTHETSSAWYFLDG